jgi:hypothetical protein
MWMDNTKMDLRELGWGGMDYIDVAQDRDYWRVLMNMVMNQILEKLHNRTLLKMGSATWS